eukprot:CAMPEP_0182891986 /NCGR_PEP_ID=MMETSP0034_2-20130328/23595_1 /TAXON_ID=156128 /ORGANISM="Nephroselmis pyriformis, Strain CCMP717" /LENGTH=83 /DNA_ID=CAMNT_0025025629 /DNA_START=59 /DNA_END=306 /DNA_ORIENTATION=-
MGCACSKEAAAAVKVETDDAAAKSSPESGPSKPLEPPGDSAERDDGLGDFAPGSPASAPGSPVGNKMARLTSLKSHRGPGTPP